MATLTDREKLAITRGMGIGTTGWAGTPEIRRVVRMVPNGEPRSLPKRPRPVLSAPTVAGLRDRLDAIRATVAESRNQGGQA